MTPGFTGSAGKIMTVTFKAKASGSAMLLFTNSSVLANDGNGTNVLTATSTATSTINGVTPVPPADLCPNIPGVQSVIPSGMILDDSGNCVTSPLPPVQPPTTPPVNPPPVINPPAVTPPVQPAVPVVQPPAPVETAATPPPAPVPNDKIIIEIPTARSVLLSAKKFLNQQNVQTATKVAAVTGVSFSFVSLLAQISQIRLWAVILSLFGLRKRKPWGVVYDSVTKKPLDPAYVMLKDANGKEVATSITDLDGRFGFLVEPGTYTIEAHKTHYIFPSARLKDSSRDEIYTDLYFGQQFSVTENNQVIAKNIPMDPEGFDWNEYAKKQVKLNKFYRIRDFWIYRASSIFFHFGFFASTLAYVALISGFNTAVILVYLILMLLLRTIFKVRPHGSIVRKGTKNGVSFAIIRIMSAELHAEIAHKVSDEVGHYYALVPNGKYYADIEEKKPDGTYEKVFTSNTFEVTRGVLQEHFEI